MAKAKLSESDWQRTVIDLAQRYGWMCAHFRPAQTGKGWRTAVQADGAGFPDLVLVRGPRLIFAELKTDTGRLSVSQKRWIDRLEGVGESVRVAVGLAVAAVAGPKFSSYFEQGAPAVEVCVWRPRDFDAVHDALRPDREAA